MASDAELEYLSPTFDPSSLTVPRLRAILVSHDIPYPSSAKKPQLIDIFTQELVPRSRKILAARSRTKRTSKGITDMPSSQEGTVNGDDDEDTILMPPPPVPDSPKRKTRRSERVSTEDSTNQLPAPRKTPSSRKSSSKHARESDTDLGQEESKQPVPRRTRKSENTPTVKIEEPEDRTARSSRRESAFSYDNPFQSGSSPLTPNEARRKSSATGIERRKSSSRRRRTEGVSGDEHSRVKQEDGIVVPSRKTFDVPVARLGKSTVKDEPDDNGIEVGEEFTPEEQLDLVRARAANGEVDIYGPRKKKRSHKTNRVPKSAPWVVIMTLLAGYATWWRREKIEVGYCGIGRPSTTLANVQIPEWASALQPLCEPCPQHAYCYEGMEARCEPDFVMKPHPLSLGGLVPLPPSCEPDGEKVRRVKAVADRAVEELRERKAKWECGDLVDEHGKGIPVLETDEADLKKVVAQKRRRGMGEAEFEELWKGAVGEILGRDEVVSSVDGPPHHPHRLLLASTSLARLPLSCAIRRSARLTLARHRIQLTALTVLLSLLVFARHQISTLRTDAARVPLLVSTTLDRLATQAALHAQGRATEPWISVSQMRDDVLREEFSPKRRERVWKRVKGVVEGNSNVRASVREGRKGEVGRVWEWIGGVGVLEDVGAGAGSWSLGPVGGTPGGRDSPAAEGRSEMGELRRWDEGRPVY